MDSITKTLKNWLLPIIGIIIVIADQGFDYINPLLILLKCPENWIGIIKILFGFYGLIHLKLALPTQNPDKLQDIIDKKKY